VRRPFETTTTTIIIIIIKNKLIIGEIVETPGLFGVGGSGVRIARFTPPTE